MGKWRGGVLLRWCGDEMRAGQWTPHGARKHRDGHGEDVEMEALGQGSRRDGRAGRPACGEIEGQRGSQTVGEAGRRAERRAETRAETRAE